MAKAKTLDLFATHKAEYAATSKAPTLVAIGPAQYLTIQGQGDPAGEVFQAAVGGLYSMAYTIKMTRKFAGQGDYKVAPLQGLWWTDGDPNAFMQVPRAQWRWKLMVRTPEFVGAADLAAARESLRKKKKPPEFEQVQLETLQEGRCVQMLHVGPYSTEPATLARMHEFIDQQGLAIQGRHHEIYLSDPRRAQPDKLKTILRWPVAPAK